MTIADAAPRTLTIKFKPNPVQHQFIMSRAKADLFSSRRGEGKSTALVWAAFAHTLENPGAHWVFMRDTFENLTKTTQKTFFEWFPPGVMGHYAVTKKEWTWAEGVAKGTVTWIGMDDPADASRLLSMEMAGFAMDEAAPAATSGGIDPMVFELAMTSLRQPGMKSYLAKIAENNPDESHWTYQKFVDPGTDGFLAWQPHTPENEHNLREDYYADLRVALKDRPDLVRRLVDGKFGFQSEGRAVTPQWSDETHLAIGLRPIPKKRVYMLWDWGHNPTCVITQVAPDGRWLILDAMAGDGIGVEELLDQEVRPLWNERYREGVHPITHIYDPAGKQREQTSVSRSPIMMVKASLGGDLRPGPVKINEGLEPLRAVLSRAPGGVGIVRVDRMRAKPVWWALRGGWFYPIARTGLTSAVPRKNEHSHPGDAMRYGAAILFPGGTVVKRLEKFDAADASSPVYFGQRKDPLIGYQGLTLPKGVIT